jgi:OOP family OmpA-OmpF porin
MRHITGLAIGLLALGCASTQSLTPPAVSPLTPGPGEGVVVDHAALIFDSSSSIVDHGHYPKQKAAYQGFVSGMPDGNYAVDAVAFGGYDRQRRPLAPFSRSDLAAHAAGIDAMGEGTPIDRVLGETEAALGGKSDRAAVVMFSDGLPTDPSGRDIGSASSVEAARAVAAAYKGNVCFHTVQAGVDPAGTEFLKAVAGVTPCGTYRTLDSLSDGAAISRFEREVFLGARQQAAAAPGDEDGDGVTDDRDRCPHTPRGARVDSRGCWTIPGLEFDTASANIRPVGKQRLDEDVLPVLRANPDMRVRIDGHTDARGSDAYNQDLSDRRAASVKEYLVSAGIPAERLESQGFGESRPIAPNDTPENLQRNRRTELTVIE